MTADWMLDETAHAGPEHFDPAFVENFERKQGIDPIDDVAVVRSMDLAPDALVVDLGTGTGRFALAIAPHCARVIAVDVSPVMLDVVRTRVAERGLPNVDCVQAGFLSYAHEGAPADLVYTRHALHHLPDFFKAVALDRIAGMLRPGGILRLRDLVFDFQPGAATASIEGWLAGAYPHPDVGYTRADLAEHVRTEYSTFSWLLEAMLDATGFDIVERDIRASIYAEYTGRRR